MMKIIYLTNNLWILIDVTEQVTRHVIQSQYPGYSMHLVIVITLESCAWKLSIPHSSLL